MTSIITADTAASHVARERTMMQLIGVTKEFSGTWALAGVDLTMRADDFVAQHDVGDRHEPGTAVTLRLKGSPVSVLPVI